MHIHHRLIVAVLVTFALGILAACERPSHDTTKENEEQAAATNLLLQMGWIPDAHQIGFWYALEQGFYRDENLEVEIIPGGLDANPVRAVATGSADVGQVSGVEQLLAALSNQLPVQLIGAIHRESPHALISLGAQISQPADLPQSRIAVAFGDAAEIHLRNMLEKYNIDESELEMVPFRFNLQPLIEGDVDAVTGFATDQPVTLRNQGLNPTILSYSDLGIQRYGYSLIVNRKTALAPEAISGFLRASRKGWIHSFAEPEKAIQNLVNRFPEGLETEVELMKLEAIRSLMLEADGSLSEWNIDPDSLRRSKEAMRRFGQLDSEVDLTDSYTNEFLP